MIKLTEIFKIKKMTQKDSLCVCLAAIALNSVYRTKIEDDEYYP